MTSSAWLLVLLCLSFSSRYSQVHACTFYVTNKCPFPIWPATASNQGHPVLANGGFHLPPGKVQPFKSPGNWTGRIWARTGCTFDSRSNSCETGDCGGQLECNGLTGAPPATLIQFALQVEKGKPDFYDVSIVDGYNLPVQVTSRSLDKKCTIPGCSGNLKEKCPEELRVLNGEGKVVACKSACLAFRKDVFCCRNAYGSPEKCRPNVYSKVFKRVCPSYYSYAYDREKPEPLVSCGSDEYVITFCPGNWGMGYSTN